MSTSLIRRNHYNPFYEFFNDPFFNTDCAQRNNSTLMKTDIREKDDQYVLDLELPGFNKEDINAELKNGYLTISAKREDNKDEKDENGNYIRRERFSGSCKRSFYVGDQMQQDDIQAEFKDGILTLEMPKDSPKKEEETASIPIS